MNTILTAINIDHAYQQFVTSDNTQSTFTEMLDIISTELDTMFQTAIPSVTSVDITTPAGSLNIPVSNNMANTIAVKVADYWALTILPTGIPINCSNIINITNTATIIIPIIESGLLSLYKGNVITPHYKDFVDIIANAVKTIIWTVVEVGPLCTSTHVVTLT